MFFTTVIRPFRLHFLSYTPRCCKCHRHIHWITICISCISDPWKSFRQNRDSWTWLLCWNIWTTSVENTVSFRLWYVIISNHHICFSISNILVYKHEFFKLFVIKVSRTCWSAGRSVAFYRQINTLWCTQMYFHFDKQKLQ